MTFLIDLFVFLAAALLIVPLLSRLGLSSVIGYLLAGILIGPSALGVIGNPEEILHFAEIGVVLLLFIIGLELQPRRLWVMRKNVFGVGVAQVVLASVALGAICWAALSLPAGSASVIGFALALSSTAFVLQLLAEQKALNQPHGRAAFGVLLFQDIAVIPALVIVSALGSSGATSFSWLSLALVIGLIVAARFLLKPVLRFIAATGIHELFIAASLAIVSGAALAMYAAGLSMGLGAFIAGMLVADSEYRHQLETDVMPFKGLLLGLFFIAVGMSADIQLLTDAPLMIFGLTAALVLVKTLVLLPVLRLTSMSGADSFRTAVVLSQGGEFAFVLLTVAASAALVTPEQTATAVLVVTLSMATTPFLMQGLERYINRAGDKREFDSMEDEPAAPVIIAGFGRFGQIVGRILSSQGHPFTALDANPGRVDFVREFGNEVYYGDATRLDMLRNAGIDNARAIVIALEDINASVRIAEMLKETFPGLKIYARALNRQHEITLRDIGVDYVIRDTLLSSLELTRNLFSSLGLDADVVDTFKAHDELTLQKQAAVAHDPQAFKQTTVEASAELKSLFNADQETQPAEPR